MRKTLIQRKEVGAGGAASIEFTSIPSTYTDLYLVVSLRTTFTTDQDHVDLLFNGSSANQTHRLMRGDGSSAASFTLSRMYTNSNSSTSNTFGNMAFYIPNYTSSNAKIISTDSVTEGNAASENQAIQATLWNDTSSISSIEIVSANSANFVQYSSASLYGVSKYNVAGGSPKATGGIISYDSTNDKWVHVFAASGTFTPSENLTAEYLVVAGGAGGARQGGGGGAGGYRSSVTGESSGGGTSAETPLSLTASTGYTVTVGAGGTGGTASYPTNGSNSVFSTITSTGGGRGGIANTGDVAGATGGSGGGGWGDSGTGGAGTANQGYAGGNGAGVGAGGGGGAGSVGANASGGNGGNGGSGYTSSITGSAIARAGGGGGGCQSIYTAGTATDGGGSGSNSNTGSATSGTSHTGGGGGGTGFVAGQSNTSTGGNGGSGIVIVRYSA